MTYDPSSHGLIAQHPDTPFLFTIRRGFFCYLKDLLNDSSIDSFIDKSGSAFFSKYRRL